MDWLKKAEELYSERVRCEEERKHSITIESLEKVPESFEGIKKIIFNQKSNNKNTDVFFNILRKATELEKILMSSYCFTWDELCSLDLRNITELSVGIKGEFSSKILDMPNLCKLSLYYYANKKTPLELILAEHYHIDFSKMPNIESLYLNGFRQLDPSDFNTLSSLKSLILKRANIVDLNWLKDAKYQLDSLYMECGLYDCSGITHQNKIKRLCLNDTFFEDASPIESLDELEVLDLRHNHIINEGKLREKRLRHLTITENDYYVNSVLGRMNMEAQWLVNEAILSIFYQNSIEITPDMPKLRREYILLERKKPFEERVMENITYAFYSELSHIKKDDFKYRGLERANITKEEYITGFVEKAKEYYSFLVV